jgi:hypothetical protein
MDAGDSLTRAAVLPCFKLIVREKKSKRETQRERERERGETKKEREKEREIRLFSHQSL